MTNDKRKGQKLIHGIIHNWLDETGEIPRYDEIVPRIFAMEDSEFNAYIKEETYTVRQKWKEEEEVKQTRLLEESNSKQKRNSK